MSIVLRAWEVDDAEWYAMATADREIQRFTNEGDVTVELMQGAITRLRENEGTFAIADAETGAPVGNIGWKRDEEGSTAEGYYWVVAGARGRGVAAAALALLLGHARLAGITSLRLVVDADNVASRRTAERAGFSCAGNGERRNDTIETVVYERDS